MFGSITGNTILGSTWVVTPDSGGSAPSTAAVPAATDGGLFRSGDVTSSSYTTYVAGASSSTGANYAHALLLCDRLSHQGGLSGTTTTAQTTNLPTAALTRYTTGEGVFIGIEIYSSVGTTGTTITASYTNQAGTSGRTTREAVFGGTGYTNAGRVLILSLQDGDTGVQSVESVTIAASTGTAGNFGVTLFKPLAVFGTSSTDFAQGFVGHNAMVGGGMQLEPILAGSCPFFLFNAGSATSTSACTTVDLVFS